MTISAEQFDRAYEILQELYHKLEPPVEDLWRKRLPEIAASEHEAIKARCEEIDAAAYELAGDVVDRKMDEGVGMNEFAKKYPELSSARRRRAWGQAMKDAVM